MQRIDDRKIRQILRRVAPKESAHAIFQVIPADRLEHNPWTAAVRLDSESMDQLTNEMISYGVREALLARRLPDHRYQLLAGGPLLEAARRIGVGTVPVIVVDLNDEAALTIALAESLTRERLATWEVAQGLAEFIETLGELGQDTDPDRVAALLDHTAEWVKRLDYIATRLPPAVLEQAGVSVHDMNVLSEEALLHAAEPSDVEERARRLRALHAQPK